MHFGRNLKDIRNTIVEERKGEYLLSSDKDKLDLKIIHHFLTSSYWAEGRRIEVVFKSIKNSFCIGLYTNETQVGFSRFIIDHVTIGYICDLFILKEHRGKGLSSWLLDFAFRCAPLREVKTWMLATADAHELYKKFGFKSLPKPERLMQRRDILSYQAKMEL